MSAWWIADLKKDVVINSIGFYVIDQRKTVEQIQIELSRSNNSDLYISCGDPWIRKTSVDGIGYRKCDAGNGIRARYVRIKGSLKSDGISVLILCEVQINGAIAPTRQCRHLDFPSDKAKPFSETLRRDTLEIKCNEGYWPRSVQNLTCQNSGYWSIPVCKKGDIINIKHLYYFAIW